MGKKGISGIKIQMLLDAFMLNALGTEIKLKNVRRRVRLLVTQARKIQKIAETERKNKEKRGNK